MGFTRAANPDDAAHSGVVSVTAETPLGRIRAWIASPVSTVGFAVAVALVIVLAAWAISSVVAGISASRADNRLKSAATVARRLLAERIDAAAGRAADVAGSPTSSGRFSITTVIACGRSLRGAT